eukprot:6556489-Prymnesium_polylepis.1
MVHAQTHQTCPDVPQTPRHPDRRRPDACQTSARRLPGRGADAARRSRRLKLVCSVYTEHK